MPSLLSKFVRAPAPNKPASNAGDAPRLVLDPHSEKESVQDEHLTHSPDSLELGNGLGAPLSLPRAATIHSSTPQHVSGATHSRSASLAYGAPELHNLDHHRQPPSTPPMRPMAADHLAAIVDSPESLPAAASSDTALSQPDPDFNPAISANSGAASSKSKKPWRSNSVSSKRPTTPSKRNATSGIAGAIAASGLAMVNPGAAMQAQLAPPLPNPGPSRERTLSGASMSNAPASLSDIRGSPQNPSIRIERESPQQRPGSPFSGVGDTPLEEDEDSEDDSDSPLLDLNDEDIPVTGFAVASNKRNADFHDLFPSAPEGDYLIEDYGCALQREILIQGRMYISENHVCFHANIFGWITDLVIPTYDIITLEKKTTAFVIPNAIQITTRKTKYTFTSFLARDTVYDVIHNIWRTARPEGSTFGDNSAAVSVDDFTSNRASLDGLPTARSDIPNGTRRRSSEHGRALSRTLSGKGPTQCACSRDGQHYPEKIIECVLPGTPDKVYTLMFASGFMKEFMRDEQKLIDIQISDWTPMASDPQLLSRNMSYIKPLSGSIGPRQTKCEIRDETVHLDYDDYVTTVTTTRTPDVPSGSVFAVKTRTCLMWAGSNSTRIIVTTMIEWTGRSFIKSVIERSALEGQRTYQADLEKHLKRYINSHLKEFAPEGGVPEAEMAEAEAHSPSDQSVSNVRAPSTDELRRATDRRGLQWALDTFTGAYKVGKQSANGAIELIQDAWDQSPGINILHAVIVVLVASNIYTFLMVGKREEVGRKKAEDRKSIERQQWISDTVHVLLQELQERESGSSSSTLPRETRSRVLDTKNSRKAEVQDIMRVLEDLEGRVQRLKSSLSHLDLD